MKYFLNIKRPNCLCFYSLPKEVDPKIWFYRLPKKVDPKIEYSTLSPFADMHEQVD